MTLIAKLLTLSQKVGSFEIYLEIKYANKSDVAKIHLELNINMIC